MQTYLGIELGSTRIKAVLIGPDMKPIATGAHDWENRLENGYWTYSLDAVWSGIQDSYRKMKEDFQAKTGEELTSIDAIGFSAMMHGYMAFDKSGELLTPFRTWRNTTTGPAAAELTALFGFNIPQRWSIAHLYQAMLNGEEHVKDIDYLTTLAGYIHWKLTGRRVLGIGEASGMFPIDSPKSDFDGGMIAKFDQKASNYPWKLRDILPEVLTAGQDAGTLTFGGAKLLDPTGKLQPGIPLCPPEGDAGTGMAATNSVAVRTGNVSAGTSVFAMIVLEKALSKCYPEIDMVTTPTGKPVAMVHCNSCTSDLDAWVGLFDQFAELTGTDISKTDLYALLYNQAMTGAADCGGMVAYNYFAGEPITGLDEGRPVFARNPSGMNLSDFIRAHLYSSVATLKLGLDILFQKEHVTLDSLLGHGGLFKTPVVGQRIMAAAAGVPVTVMETAGEGGPYGMALLTAYMCCKAGSETLEDFLKNRVFFDAPSTTIAPTPEDLAGFSAYIARYSAGLAMERAAVDTLKRGKSI